MSVVQNIMSKVETPVHGLLLLVLRDPRSGVLHVRSWNRELGTYDGVRWSLDRPVPDVPYVMLRDGHAWGDLWHVRPEYGDMKDHPFWEKFVRDVENAFPVAEVMLG